MITEGENGFLFEAGDFKQLGILLKTMADSPGLVSQMGSSALRTVVDEYNIRKIATAFANAIRSATERNHESRTR